MGDIAGQKSLYCHPISPILHGKEIGVKNIDGYYSFKNKNPLLANFVTQK